MSQNASKGEPSSEKLRSSQMEEAAAMSRSHQMKPREEFQIPSLVGGLESSRSYKGRICKQFNTNAGCSYGDKCAYLHDEQSKYREREAIRLGPGSGGGHSNSPTSLAPNLKPLNWKTRICNKWALSGFCPFGTKCNYAHGAEDLHSLGGGVPGAGVVVGSTGASPHSGGYHRRGAASQPNAIQGTDQKTYLERKGLDKMNRIYGDWIDDLADLD